MLPRFAVLVFVLAACGRQEPAPAAGASGGQVSAPPQTPRAAPLHWPADPMEHQLAALAPPGATAGLPACAEEAPAVTASAVGPLGTDLTVASFGARCPSALLGWDLGDEAIPEPAAVVRLGAVAVRVVFADTLPASRLARLVVTDSGVRTPAGVGPGSSAAALRGAYGEATLQEGECVLEAVFASHPGLRFRLDLPEGTECDQISALARGGLAGLPSATRVAELILYPVRPDASRVVAPDEGARLSSPAPRSRMRLRR